MLCEQALKTYEKYGHFPDGRIRGTPVLYDSLPGAVPKAVLPLFGQAATEEWLARMKFESTQYSKGSSGKRGSFKGDSERKEEAATEEIKKAADVLVGDVYTRMVGIYAENLLSITRSQLPLPVIGGKVDWNKIKQ